MSKLCRRAICVLSILVILAMFLSTLGITPVMAAGNLVGYWTLDDGSGATAADSSGYGHPGILTGGDWSASHAPTPFANTGSLSLNGISGQGINAAQVTSATDNLTLSAWTNWAGANSLGQMLIYNGDSGPNGYGIYIPNNGTLQILNGGVALAASTFHLTPGVWQYVVAMRDNGVWKLYVDGTQLSLDSNPSPNPPSGQTSIGRSGAVANEAFNGMIDDARIYDRVLAASELCSPAITVTNANDSGAGSLRQAIAGLCSGGTISFNGSYTIPLASQLEIGSSVTIDGAGHNVTISGNNAVRVFHIDSGATAALKNLTIANGKMTATGPLGYGGGIFNDGSLMIMNSTLADNNATTGGAIYNNAARTLTVTNSTISNNNANGGGIYISAGALATITNSTFSGNHGIGGGIVNWSATSTVKNTIIANSAADENCYSFGVAFAAGSTHNLADDATCGASFTNSPSILLGALGNYGGSTQTLALLPGSAAINAGDSAGCNSLDQRGVTRPAACDIGAFESQGFTLTKTGGDSQSTMINTAFTNPLTLSVTSAFSEPVNNGQVTFTGPSSGASTNPTVNNATVASGGVSRTVTANSTTGGPYNVTASAAGATDINFMLSNQAATTTALTSDLNPSTFGASVTFTAIPSAGTGTVTFKDNGTNIIGCVGLSLSAGKATCAISTLAVGTHPITAVYSGDAIYAGSTSNTVNQVVNPVSTTTALTSDLNPSTFGAPVTFTVIPSAGTGTVTFKDNGTNIIGCVGLSLSAGKATCAIFTLAVGAHPITAVYSGDAIYAGSTSNTVNQAVNPAVPTVTTGAATLVTATGATLNGTVNANGASTSVTFEYGLTTAYGASVAAVPGTVNGTADTAVSFGLTSLTPNTLYHYHVLGVNSAGTTNSLDGTFTTLSVVITTEIHGASTHTPVMFAAVGDNLHVQASLTHSGLIDPTGSVSFTKYDNISCYGSGAPAGTLPLSGAIAHPSLSAPLTNNGLSFKAHYLGDSNYPPADSACASISASPYPTILSLSTSTIPNDGAILTTLPSGLTVQFNRDVRHGDPTNGHSADNPANYLLVSPGPNGLFDTSACGPLSTAGLKPDDVQVPITSVSYDPATFTAALHINKAAQLVNGAYRLFICGTTSITDAADTTFLNNHLSDSLVNFTVAVPSSSSSSTAAVLPATGFAPGQVTLLPPQTVSYTNLGDLWLEISRLDIKTAIVGVPLSKDGATWDISWLGSRAGWLNGTAFPTRSGNSLLTGHVWNADNTPGLFANLNQLSYGDQVKLHAFGQVYTFEVRDTRLVSPSAVYTALKHEELSWVTLLTCEDFSPHSTQYAYRRMVRAVLVSVTAEK